MIETISPEKLSISVSAWKTVIRITSFPVRPNTGKEK